MWIVKRGRLDSSVLLIIELKDNNANRDLVKKKNDFDFQGLEILHELRMQAVLVHQQREETSYRRTGEVVVCNHVKVCAFILPCT